MITWIDSKKIPPIDLEVLVYLKSYKKGLVNKHAEAWWDGNQWIFITWPGTLNDLDNYEITHWTLLPEPPK